LVPKKFEGFFFKILCVNIQIIVIILLCVHCGTKIIKKKLNETIFLLATTAVLGGKL
jgi:hypothetical protein